MSDADQAAFARQRQAMVDCQLRTFDVTDQLVLARMNHVPREMFVAPAQQQLAYSDAALSVPGAAGPRALLLPMALARLLQDLLIEPGDHVLDVGGGLGYSAAVIAGLAGSVVALESDPAFSAAAKAAFAAGGLSNAEAVTGSLSAGCAAKAPFDVILVNGAVETGLDALLAQLADGGRLACIEVADRTAQAAAGRAVIYEKSGTEHGRRTLFPANAPRLPEFTRAPAFAF